MSTNKYLLMIFSHKYDFSFIYTYINDSFDSNSNYRSKVQLSIAILMKITDELSLQVSKQEVTVRSHGQSMCISVYVGMQGGKAW